jgi:uncharacterized membrane protein
MDTIAAVPLAAASAAFYGAADFCGGLAARRSSGITAATLAQSFGLVAVGIATLAVGGTPTQADLLWGALSGVAGGLGLAIFFEALAIGRMATVAPVTAVTCAMVPIAVGLAMGERPSGVAIAGLALAGVAIVLVSREPARAGDAPAPAVSSGRVIGLALVAGIFFGGFYAALAHTTHTSGVWPVLANRVAAVPMLWVLLRVQRGRQGAELREPGLLRVAALSGGLDIVANCLFLYASHAGALSLVGTVASLYPASTVLLAVVVLREHLDWSQRVGLVATIGAIALIARG